MYPQRIYKIKVFPQVNPNFRIGNTVGAVRVRYDTVMGTTPNRNIRIPDELWNAAQERATREDVNLSQLIRRYLRAYAEDARTFKW